MNSYRKQGGEGGYPIVSPPLLHPSAEPRSTNPLFSTTCALFAHSFAQSGKSSAFFSMACALFAKTWGCTAIILYPGPIPEGPNWNSLPLSCLPHIFFLSSMDSVPLWQLSFPLLACRRIDPRAQPLYS